MIRTLSIMATVAGLSLSGVALAVPEGIAKADFQSAARQRLLRADADKDGRISKAEWTQGRKTGKRDPGRMFDRLDADRNGFLDAAEIDGLTARRFARVDGNGDGVLTAEERQAARGAMGGESPAD